MILRRARRQDRIGFVKEIHAFLQMGLRKDPRHSDVPLALDLAKSEQDREALELMMSPSLFARPFVAPPDIPKERLEALRGAFMDTLKDPELLADAAKTRIPVDAVSGQEIADELTKIYAIPRAVVERVKEAVERGASEMGERSAVRTESGWISGTKSDDATVHVFKGVPYAQPPVGELRWRAPEPLSHGGVNAPPTALVRAASNRSIRQIRLVSSAAKRSLRTAST